MFVRNGITQADFSEARILISDFVAGSDPAIYALIKSVPGDRASDTKYNFADMSIDPFREIVMPITSDMDVSVAVHEYSKETPFKISLKTFACPNANCGNGETGTCDTATKKCACKDDYKWAAAGDSCENPLFKNKPMTGSYQGIVAQKKTHFYQFQQKEVSEAKFVVTRKQTTGTMMVYASRGNAEKRHPTESDFDYKTTLFPGDVSTQLVIPGAHFNKADWVIGVHAYQGDSDYALTPLANDCPNNCSGTSNGKCDVTTHICKCNEGFDNPDCSLDTKSLTAAGRDAELGGFESLFYTFHVSNAQANSDVALSVDLKIPNTYKGALPRVYLNKASAPTDSNYMFTSPLPLSLIQSVSLPPRRPDNVGSWFVRVQNPSHERIPIHLGLGSLSKCLNGCSDHGDCSELAVCTCHSGWTGPDCSVSSRTVHWAVVVVIGFLACIIGLFISHFFIKKGSASNEAPNTNYAQLSA